MNDDKQLCFGDDFAAKGFGADIKRHRLSAGFTQSDVARMIGLSLVQYGRIERANARPSLQVFLWFCYVYNINPLLYLHDDAKTPITEHMFKQYDFRIGRE